MVIFISLLLGLLTFTVAVAGGAWLLWAIGFVTLRITNNEDIIQEEPIAFPFGVGLLGSLGGYIVGLGAWSFGVFWFEFLSKCLFGG